MQHNIMNNDLLLVSDQSQIKLKQQGDNRQISIVLTEISKNDFLQINETVTGKKSSSCPGILNSMVPDELDWLMTGIVQLNIFLRLSCS